jgi:hypothetical protein
VTEIVTSRALGVVWGSPTCPGVLAKVAAGLEDSSSLHAPPPSSLGVPFTKTPRDVRALLLFSLKN